MDPNPSDSAQEKNPEDVVVSEAPKTRLSGLWKKEDYWAIWLGFLLLVAGVVIYLPRGPEGLLEKSEKAEAVLDAEKDRAPFKTIA